MKQTEFYSQFTAQEIEDILFKSKHKPFIIVNDEESKCKRLFLTQEDADKWFQARSEGTMTDEILQLEFAGNTIPGDEQFELRVNITNPVSYALKGTTGNCVFFNFATVDKASQQATGEAVDIYFTISNGDGVRLKPKVYTYEEGKTYSFNLDNYLSTGVNTISLMVHGRTSGLNKVVTMTYEILNFSLTTPFNISKSLSPDESLSITYTCIGDYQRTVHFYIDGKEVAAETISAIEQAPTKVKVFPLFGQQNGVGTHSIQMKASMSLNETVFWSDLLFREFEVTGEDHTTTLVSNDFPNTQDVFNGALPGFSAKQFETKSLIWAYYSSKHPTANVTWRLFAPDGTETTIGSRQADVVEGETDVMPEPVKFMPTESGVFLLQALVQGEVIKEYSISVEPNEDLTEATDGMVIRLTSIGRSNQEEENYRKDWSCTKNGIHSYCEFSEGFPFTAAAGYNNGGVEFYNKYTGIIKGYKPMAVENVSVAKNGFCIGMRFRTFNMDDENAVVAKIGNPESGAGIFVYPNKAILRSSAGRTRDVEVRFKDEEDTDLYWIVYPNHDSDMSLFTFMQVNGVRCFPRLYDTAENFNVGSTADDSDYGFLHLGDPNGYAGIRVYSIRAYVIYQNERQLCNNFIIDSGDLTTQIEKNDIYQKGGGMLDVDVTKLEERMPLIKFTTNMAIMEGSEGKPELNNVGVELTHPDYYDHYATCELANLKKAGQSTQDRLGPPSLHVKFNKNKSNVLKNRNGKLYPKNRIPILPGYVPENSLRLLNNTLDSSCCHSGGALTFINRIAQDTSIDGKHPLRTPQQEYVLSGQYSEDMRAKYKDKLSDYTYPYKHNFTPVAYAGAAIYRVDEDSPWQWLGMYTFIEEKKAFRSNGGNSIRDKITEDGKLDPLDVYSGQKGETLVDNTGYLRFEIVTKGKYSMMQKGGELTFDTDIAERETEIEKISEHDDETSEQTMQDWTEFGNEVIKPLCATEGNQEAFDAIIWDIFNIYNVCAYYIWMLIVCNTDGSFRNMNLVRYHTGGKWNIVPWDWDMILGLLQDTYRLDAEPTSDLYTKVDGTYIYNGMGNRIPGETGLDSFWFWDACLNNKEFKTMLPKMFAAMYSAGMNKTNWINAFDKFTNSFSPALYNVDALGKYINPYYNFKKNYLVSDQGDRTAHRHWFLDTNVDFFEQLFGVGDFVNTRTSTRAADAENAKLYCTAGATAYFGWTISGEESDPENSRTDRMMIGQKFEMTVKRKLTSKDILGVLSPLKLERLDMHEFARFFSADLQFNSCYNTTTGVALMKELILGMTLDDIKQYGLNERAVNTIDGVSLMSRLETFSIRGLYGLKSNPDISGCTNLHNFYAAGSGLTAFNPANGSTFINLELNDTIGSFKCTDVTFPKDGPTFLTVEQGTDAVKITCPTSLLVLNLTGMGRDEGTHALLHNWLMMLKDNPELLSQAQITCKGIDWRTATKEDVLTLAKITMHRSISGYIYCPNLTYTLEEMSLLLDAFGPNVFDIDYKTLQIVCDCDGDGIQISASGETVFIDETGTTHVTQGHIADFSGAGFPIGQNSSKNHRWLVWIDGEWMPKLGSDDMPMFVFGDKNEYTLNHITGELHTTELSNVSTTLRILCIDNTSFVSGEMIVLIDPRVYPTQAQIYLKSSQSTPIIVDGEYLITTRGSYLFEAKHLPVDYTGTMLRNNDNWELINGNEEYVIRSNEQESDNETQFCLLVIKLPDDDMSLTLKYRSRWNDNTTELTAEDIHLAVVAVIDQLLINNRAVGNEELFKAVESAGIPHAQVAYYSSMELKLLIGSFNVADLLTQVGVNPYDLTSLNSGRYYIPQYMKNVTDFNLSNTGLNLNITFDAEKTSWVRKINLQGTFASIKI